MNKDTNLEQVKWVALGLLKVKPIETPYSPMIVNHPFTNSGILGGYDKETKQNIMLNITKDEDFEVYLRMMEERINKITDIEKLICIMNAPYVFLLLKDSYFYLSKKDISRVLRRAYQLSEYTSSSPNVTKKDIIHMFRNADKTELMTEYELNIFSQLDDKITIYRGIRDNKKSSVFGMSWTLDSEKAYWFANRFGDDGYVYQAQIDKMHIFAYFDEEKEIVVEPRYLENIKIYRETTDIFQI